MRVKNGEPALEAKREKEGKSANKRLYKERLYKDLSRKEQDELWRRWFKEAAVQAARQAKQQQQAEQENPLKARHSSRQKKKRRYDAAYEAEQDAICVRLELALWNEQEDKKKKRTKSAIPPPPKKTPSQTMLQTTQRRQDTVAAEQAEQEKLLKHRRSNRRRLVKISPVGNNCALFCLQHPRVDRTKASQLRKKYGINQTRMLYFNETAIIAINEFGLGGMLVAGHPSRWNYMRFPDEICETEKVKIVCKSSRRHLDLFQDQQEPVLMGAAENWLRAKGYTCHESQGAACPHKSQGRQMNHREQARILQEAQGSARLAVAISPQFANALIALGDLLKTVKVRVRCHRSIVTQEIPLAPAPGPTPALTPAPAPTQEEGEEEGGEEGEEEGKGEGEGEGEEEGEEDGDGEGEEEGDGDPERDAFLCAECSSTAVKEHGRVCQICTAGRIFGGGGMTGDAVGSFLAATSAAIAAADEAEAAEAEAATIAAIAAIVAADKDAAQTMPHATPAQTRSQTTQRTTPSLMLSQTTAQRNNQKWY